MHKYIEVAEVVIDEATAAIIAVGEVYRPDHLPVGVVVQKAGGVDRRDLNDWLKSRSIPASRAGIWDLYTKLGRESAEYLVLECYGFSLSDHYWLRPAASGLTWGAANFFTNEFSRDVGDILFGHATVDSAKIDLVSPDLTSDGWLRKRWVVAEGKRLLVKGGSGVWKQEPFNEVVASAVMQRLGVPHVAYSLTFEGGEPYSVCENFLNERDELVPAWRVVKSLKRRNEDSELTHLLRCCDTLGVPSVRAALDKMLTIDYLIANEDRHYGNFGFVRDAETLEWAGFAPIYDSGTSLWHNSLRVGGEVECKPFRKRHGEQIRLVRDFSWYDRNLLDGIDDEIRAIYAQSQDIDEARAAAIAAAVLARASAVAKMR